MSWHILGKLSHLSLLPLLSCVTSGRLPDLSVLPLLSCVILHKLPNFSVLPLLRCVILSKFPAVIVLPLLSWFFFFFFFLLQKALLFPFGPRLERGLQGVKKLPSGCREGLQAALMLGGFFNGHWSPEVLSRAEG